MMKEILFAVWCIATAWAINPHAQRRFPFFNKNNVRSGEGNSEGGYYQFFLSPSSSKFNQQLAIEFVDSKRGQVEEVWRSLENEPFLVLNSLVQERPPIANGNFQVQYEKKALTNCLSISSIVSEDSYLIVEGQLLHCAGDCRTLATFSINFSTLESEAGLLPVVTFAAQVTPLPPLPSSSEFAAELQYSSSQDESFHGFGETFAPLNLQGLRIPILVSEQGVGRGLQPITDYLNTEKGEGVGGHWFTTYAPKPLYLTNHKRVFLLHTSYTSFFDLTRSAEGIVVVEVWSLEFSGRVMVQRSMLNCVQAITAYTGRQPPLASWTQFGAIVGLEGGTANVTQIVHRLLDGQVEIAGVWLQDWVVSIQAHFVCCGLLMFFCRITGLATCMGW